ncbi:hypothetical protein Dsin_009515 [Dipteronia sinensis]|uniref:Uncharacterized protein n=1 Tax=Dipteronia sinensis TaxID=43782 RepID=A0AAE0EDJ5_9ROSI|nr:hypothetical protein Dsin_009515 [Dipteronia sinensis]
MEGDLPPPRREEMQWGGSDLPQPQTDGQEGEGVVREIVRSWIREHGRHLPHSRLREAGVSPTDKPIWNSEKKLLLERNGPHVARISVFETNRLLKNNLLGYCEIDMVECLAKDSDSEFEVVDLLDPASCDTVVGTISLSCSVEKKKLFETADKNSDGVVSMDELASLLALQQEKKVNPMGITLPSKGRKSRLILKIDCISRSGSMLESEKNNTTTTISTTKPTTVVALPSRLQLAIARLRCKEQPKINYDSLNRTMTINKFYNRMDFVISAGMSTKDKVKKFCNFFKTCEGGEFRRLSGFFWGDIGVEPGPVPEILSPSRIVPVLTQSGLAQAHLFHQYRSPVSIGILSITGVDHRAMMVWSPRSCPSKWSTWAEGDP